MKYDVKVHKNKPFTKTIKPSWLNEKERARRAISGECIKRWAIYENRIISHTSTVEIVYYNHDGSKTIEEYGYITVDEVIQSIKDGKDIILDYCYVNGLILMNINIKNIFSSIHTFFDGLTDFSGTTFSAQADFSEATFSGETYFSGATFGEKAHFIETIFNKKAYFATTTFSEEANFIGTIFIDEAYFRVAKFILEADFSGTTFSRSAYFNRATFSAEAYFKRTRFRGLLMIGDCIIEKTVNFIGAKFKLLCLTNVKNHGYIYFKWERNRNGLRKAIYNYAKKYKLSYYQTGLQFLILKENFNKLSQYNNEDKAYVEIRRCEALSELINENKDELYKVIIRMIIYPFKWLVSDFIGLYATSPLRILSALCLNIVGFGVIYQFLGVHINKLENGILGSGRLVKFLEAIYFSAITSFTVGYGDIAPERFLVAGLASVESFIGVFLMSYFTVAFTKKVLR